MNTAAHNSELLNILESVINKVVINISHDVCLAYTSQHNQPILNDVEFIGNNNTVLFGTAPIQIKGNIVCRDIVFKQFANEPKMNLFKLLDIDTNGLGDLIFDICHWSGEVRVFTSVRTSRDHTIL